MTHSVGNWVGETTDTVGTGDIHLTGPFPGYTSFASIGETEFWYAIVDGDDREAGIATLVNGDTLVRDAVYSILQGGQYFDLGPPPLSLSGSAQVFSTFNKTAFDMFLEGGDNNHDQQHLLYGPDHKDVDLSIPKMYGLGLFLQFDEVEQEFKFFLDRRTKVHFSDTVPVDSNAGDLWLVI